MTTLGRRRVRRGLSLMTALIGILMLAASVGAQGKTVVVLPTTGIVDQGMAQYLADGIANAERDGAAAVVIKLNTPGGFLTTTNDIVGTVLEAPLPVIVWVAPAGGFAASAGTFITLAGNIALMAPGTSIGAASPVSAEGGDIPETLHDKVYNDAIAKITAIAEERGRNVAWAVEAVSKARSSPANEAAELGVVDGVAATLDDVIEFANGREVTVAGETVTLDLNGAVTSEVTMSPFLSFIRLLSDPTIAFLLFSVGSAGLIAELWQPNFVTGILGGIAIILAFIGLGALPLNVGGLILVIFGLVLIGLELTVTSHGLLGFGGVVCLAIGASALYRPPVNPFEPFLQVAPALIVVITVTAGVFVALISIAAVRTRTMLAPTGGVGGTVPSGTAGIVRRPLEPLGSIFAGGEEWSAKTADGQQLDRGTAVKVVGSAGLTLIVEPDTSSSS